ncbi:RNA polymerase sigma-54 factor [gut metagenome]|uniref:RNA polymerase sigma-54 factor n=1 Tax=gut metagenome TaxID=749906 RepID=J9FY72_9ZZZZ
MAQSSTQTQDMVQTTRLSAVQVALSNLLELPLNDMVDRIQNEVDANAALEVGEENPQSEENENWEGEEGPTEETSPIESELADFRTMDDVPEQIRSRAENSLDPLETLVANSDSFYEELHRQMADFDLNEHESQIVDYLIGSLDDDGYLHKDLLTILDELEIYNGIETSEAELQRLLRVLQQFEPRGIGARNLQECLVIQLMDPQNTSPWREMALQVVSKYFKDFYSKNWKTIMNRLKIGEDEMEHVRHLITHLNPRPGRLFGDSKSNPAQAIIPDFFVKTNSDGSLDFGLNNSDLPQLHLSASYLDSMEALSKKKGHLSRSEQDEYTYISKKVEDAKSFIYLLERRNQTLLAVMKSIITLQRPFFDDDDETLLKPLKLQEIADHAGVQISTVSRAVSSKYVQTNYKIYPLKFFFSNEFTASSGQKVSSREVKAKLQEIIDQEDKQAPYADEALVALLKEAGFPVARRTVVKYRDQLHIPTAKMRKV